MQNFLTIKSILMRYIYTFFEEKLKNNGTHNEYLNKVLQACLYKLSFKNSTCYRDTKIYLTGILYFCYIFKIKVTKHS